MSLNEIDALVDAVEPDGRLALAFDVDLELVSLAQPPRISSRPSMVLHASPYCRWGVVSSFLKSGSGLWIT